MAESVYRLALVLTKDDEPVKRSILFEHTNPQFMGLMFSNTELYINQNPFKHVISYTVNLGLANDTCPY